jgi:hypothetical protein
MSTGLTGLTWPLALTTLIKNLGRHRVDQLKASETDLKNIVYREKDAREVLEYEYKQLSHECVKHMELREA